METVQGILDNHYFALCGCDLDDQCSIIKLTNTKDTAACVETVQCILDNHEKCSDDEI